ncbi:MAG: AsmA family protein [Pseudomonadota bacterium]
MKLIKYLIIAIVVLVLVLVAGAGILVATVDPNDYKDEIVKQVKDATGRTLTLDGDIGFTFFPKLGVSLGEAQLSNAAGFGDQPFAQVKEVGVSVDLLSLLKLNVQADTIVLKGLRVNLQKNKNGQTNWDDLTEVSATEASASDSKDAKEGKEVGLEIAGVDISDSQVVYDDQQANNKITLTPIDLETGSIGSGNPSYIKATLGFAQTNPEMTATITFNSDARLNLTSMVYQLSDMVINVEAKGSDLPNGAIDLAMTGNVDADLKNEAFALEPINIEILDTSLNGDLTVQSFSKPKIEFALQSDEIDLDKLLPESSTDTETSSSSASTSADDKIELPTDMLRDLNINGSLNVNTLKVSGLTVTDVAAKITGQNGVINLNPLSMNLYEGTYTGSAGLNVTGSTPKYSASSDLKHLQIAGLLSDLSEDGKSFIRGKAGVKFNVTTAGDRVSTLKKQLNGSAEFAAGEGAFQSENLAKSVEQVVAFLKQRAPKPAGEELVFDSLSGTAQITNGVAKNNDLKLVTPLIYGNGKGDVNIGADAIDYVMAVGLAENTDRAGIPITIKGDLNEPKFGVDLKGALKEQQKELINEQKGKIEEEVNKKIGDKLKDLKLF